MCGIVGSMSLSGAKISWRKQKKFFCEMLNIQKHRGPDDQGIVGFQFLNQEKYTLDMSTVCEEPLDGLLGFNRLSIRDLSYNGHQPMSSIDQKVLIAFNGEIYNADTYREKLKKKGYRFRSTTDTEVILNMYLEYGMKGMLTRLNGMYAIVIVDLRKRKMFLARDRFGIKPLYYMTHGKSLYFASEYKSFLVVPGFLPEIDEEVLNEYMIFISSPNNVLLKGIYQVHPGEVVIVDGEQIFREQYFEVDHYVHTDDKVNLHEKIAELDDILAKAVDRQMVSDVKVGCQLSGGVDSSLISYYAVDNSKNTMKDSVSIVFRDMVMNEEAYIDQVAEKLNIVSHKYLMDTDELIGLMRKGIWHLETIMTIPNANALLLLTQQAKKDVTVLLSGEGADEVFGGYSQYNKFLIAEKYFSDNKFKKIVDSSGCTKKWFGKEPEDLKDFAVRSKIYVNPTDVARMLQREVDESSIRRRCEQFEKYSGSPFDKFFKYEIETYLPELLMRQDKMSMANSIENRVPFLDNSVVDYSFQLPVDVLVNVNRKEYGVSENNVGMRAITGKYILKELCAKKFDKEFSYRGKGGFGLPLKYYMGTEMFSQMFNEQIWDSMKKRSYLNIEYVKWLYKRLPVLDWQEVELLWRAISIELYFQLFIDARHEDISELCSTV